MSIIPKYNCVERLIHDLFDANFNITIEPQGMKRFGLMEEIVTLAHKGSDFKEVAVYDRIMEDREVIRCSHDLFDKLNDIHKQVCDGVIG